MRISTLTAPERFVVQEPAGVDDTTQKHSGGKLRQLASYPVQIYQHSSSSSTVHVEIDYTNELIVHSSQFMKSSAYKIELTSGLHSARRNKIK